MNIVEFVLALVGGAAQLLEAQKSKAAQQVGVVAADVDAVTLAVLQAAAAAKGQAIDWTNPTAVADYVSSLPVFAPIPAPSPAPAGPAAAEPPSAT